MTNGHGDDLYKYTDIRANFSSNVYNHFSHQGLFDYLSSRMTQVLHYPEPTPMTLEGELATHLGLQPDQVMVTNGATEAIYLIAQLQRRGRTAILAPTFAEYADACRIHEHTISFIYGLDQIPQDADSLWLCNPNNPTGSVLPIELLLHTIEEHPHTLFVIDASYAPFTRETLPRLDEMAEVPNVVMLHSMTKEYAIPGLRLGYVTGPANLLQRLRLQRMPWSVNQMALEAGHYLLQHRQEFSLPLEDLLQERTRVAAALSTFGVIEVWPSDSHILLCKLRFGQASQLKEWLATELGILIRDASNFEGLDASFFRIAVQTREENDELIKAISEWIAL